jgi:hypothetical protein
MFKKLNSRLDSRFMDIAILIDSDFQEDIGAFSDKEQMEKFWEIYERRGINPAPQIALFLSWIRKTFSEDAYIYWQKELAKFKFKNEVEKYLLLI